MSAEQSPGGRAVNPFGGGGTVRALRLHVPKVGLAVGTGLFVADSITNFVPTLHLFGGRGAGYELAIGWALYVAPCAVLDALLRAAWPEARRAYGLVRFALALGLFAVAGHLIGRGWLVSLLLLGGLWAALALWRWTALLAAVALVLALLPALPRKAQGPRTAVGGTAPADAPSIAVIVLDTLRRDHTSAYGYERDTTPNLARLAARGVRFDRAYSTSCWTLPSHASIFTGLLPEQHGANGEGLVIHDTIPTLAELVRLRGYETAAFTANPWISRDNGLGRGFSHFEEFWQPFSVRATFLSWQVATRVFAPPRDKGGAAIVRAVDRWLTERDPRRPYFLFVNLLEAHAPYQEVSREFRLKYVPPGLSRFRIEKAGTFGFWAQQAGFVLSDRDARLNVDLMDGAAAAADHYLGLVLRRLGEDVTVFVAADHGELLGEHDLFGHTVGLYEPLIHIPMVMAGPGVPPGVVVEDLTSLVDIAPTVLALSGGPGLELPGENLLSLARGEHRLDRAVRAQQFRIGDLRERGWYSNRGEAVAAALAQRRLAVVTSRFKRVVAADGTDELYDLVEDPSELHPLRGSDSSLEVSLPTLAQPVDSSRALSESTREALRALGYVK